MKIIVCDLEPALILAHHFRQSVEAQCPNQAKVSFAVGDFFKPETIPKAELYVLSQHIHGQRLLLIGSKVKEKLFDIIINDTSKSL